MNSHDSRNAIPNGEERESTITEEAAENLMESQPPLLYKYVLGKQWDRVLQRLENEQQLLEVSFRDDFGLSALHRACYRDAPVSVIAALLLKVPRALLLQQDTCEFSGLTPLHAACHYCSPEVVALLLQANPQSLSLTNKKGQTPLTCLCQVYQVRIKHFLDHTSQARHIHLLHDDPVLLRFLHVSALLLSAHVHSPTSQTTSLEHITQHMLNACAINSATTPPILLELSLKLYPEQLSIPIKGNLPLHLCIEYYQAQDPQNTLPLWKEAFDSILNAYPQAASQPNINSHIPFDLARKYCLPWDQGMNQLLQIYPHAIHRLGFSHHSICTILAKAANSKHDSTSTLFALLQSDPILCNF